ncbi:MAG: hypothetical protein ACRBN8_03955 [Nannocystales bacterium]
MGAGQSDRRHTSRGGIPWTRALFALAVIGPALVLGGVHPQTLAAWSVVVGVLLWRLARKSRAGLARPWPALVLVFLAGWTLLAALPIPGVRPLLAPTLQAWVDGAVLPGATGPPGLSVTPGDTAVEALRLGALAAMVVVGSQLSWRLSAAAVSAAGLAVSGLGFVHALLGATSVYGLYVPVHETLLPRTALLGSFINPNHQAGLLLLSVFAAAALAVDQLHGARTARDAARVTQRRERGVAMIGALLLLIPALLLSLSRGALLVFAVLAPIGLLVGLVRPPASHGTKPHAQRRGPVIAGAAALVCLVILVGRHGPWAELLALFDDPGRAFEQKLGPARDGWGLITRSPVLGTGRGTFIDLLPLHAPGDDLVYTHLESTPVTALVEWGPLIGGVAVLAAVLWWVAALRHRAKGRERRARGLLLLGVAAVLLQSTVDFSLEFIGVAAPLAALVGALTPHGRRVLPRRATMRLAPGLALVSAVAILGLAPHTWTCRTTTNAQVSAGEREISDALRWRPLDGGLHAVAARLALTRGDISAAGTHAELATRTQSGSIDAWLMLAAVHHHRGSPQARDEAVAQALDRVRDPAPAILVEYIRARYPDATQAEAVTPSRPRAFRAVVRGLREAGALDHADAMARTRARTHPNDPAPLLVRSRVALERDQVALALHFALLARGTSPDSADAHLAVARATARRHGVDAALDVLSAASQLAPGPREQRRIDELRVRLLIQDGGPSSLESAHALAQNLLLHSTDAEQRTRHRALVGDVARARNGE